MVAQRQRYFYRDLKTRMEFFSNLQDGPSAYQVQVGEDRFYIPDRVLPELAARGYPHKEISQRLENIDLTIPFILEKNGINIPDFHAALQEVHRKEMAPYFKERGRNIRKQFAEAVADHFSQHK